MPAARHFLRRISVQVDSCFRRNDDRRRRRNDEGGRRGNDGRRRRGNGERGRRGNDGRERRQRDISCVAFPRKWIPAFAGMTRGEGAGRAGGEGAGMTRGEGAGMTGGEGGGNDRWKPAARHFLRRISAQVDSCFRRNDEGGRAGMTNLNANTR